ncbi:hypothetical protein Tco_1454628 [Tanacetum coccineum]
MAGPEPITPLNEGTSNQNSKSIIEGHVSALKEPLQEPSNQNLIKPMLLDFDDIQDVSDDEVQDDVKGKIKIDEEDLSKPFKEVLKCPFTRRIVEFIVRPQNADNRQDIRWNGSHKCLELAKCFSDSIPKTVDDMLKRVDDYLWSEEAFRNIELPRGRSNDETRRYNGCNEATEANGSPMGATVIGDPSNRAPTTLTLASTAGRST